MFAFRSRIRFVALAWLLCQAASLAAFVPEDCCEKHVKALAASHHQPEAAPDCHESAEAAPAPEPEPGTECPMPHGDGEACPMHRSQTGECCGISSTCDGPNRPLASLFSFVGVIDAPAEFVTSPPSETVTADPPAPLLSRLPSPDAPPPKA
jgi:hypothetical protein